jgi:hypothetical protein
LSQEKEKYTKNEIHSYAGCIQIVKEKFFAHEHQCISDSNIEHPLEKNPLFRLDGILIQEHRQQSLSGGSLSALERILRQ